MPAPLKERQSKQANRMPLPEVYSVLNQNHFNKKNYGTKYNNNNA